MGVRRCATAGRTLDAENPTNWDHPLSRRLVAHWQAIEGTAFYGGPQLRDLCFAKRVRNNGTLTNGAAWTGQAGRSGGFGGIRLDGTDDFVNVPYASAFDASVTGKMTVSCWANFVSVPSGGTGAGIVCKWRTASTTARNWLLYLDDGTGKLAYFIRQSDSTQISVQSSVSPSAGVWYHLAGVADGNGADTLIMYVNGVPSVSGYNGTLANDATTNICFGRLRQDDATFSANAVIGSVRLYDRGLTAAEVAALYAEESRGSPELLNWMSGRVWPQAAAAGQPAMKRMGGVQHAYGGYQHGGGMRRW